MLRGRITTNRAVREYQMRSGVSKEDSCEGGDVLKAAGRGDSDCNANKLAAEITPTETAYMTRRETIEPERGTTDTISVAVHGASAAKVLRLVPAGDSETEV